MNLQKLRGDVGTGFIASTSAHIEPWPGRDLSRPYMLIPDFFVHIHHCALFPYIGLERGRNESRPRSRPGSMYAEVDAINRVPTNRPRHHLCVCKYWIALAS